MTHYQITLASDTMQQQFVGKRQLAQLVETVLYQRSILSVPARCRPVTRLAHTR